MTIAEKQLVYAWETDRLLRDLDRLREKVGILGNKLYEDFNIEGMNDIEEKISSSIAVLTDARKDMDRLSYLGDQLMKEEERR